MANTIILQGSFTATIDSLQARGSLNTTIYITGSNMVSENANIGTSSYQALNTGSLVDTRFIYLYNNGDYQINVASDSAGTNQVAQLQIGDTAMLPYSGSKQLYARANTSASVLSIIITES